MEAFWGIIGTWRLWASSGSHEMFPNLQFVKKKSFVKFTIFMQFDKNICYKVQSEVIGTSGSCLFGFVHSVYNHFIFGTGQKTLWFLVLQICM